MTFQRPTLLYPKLSLPTFKMWHSMLDVSSLLHLLSLHYFFCSLLFLIIYRFYLVWLNSLDMHLLWYCLAFWHLITWVESRWKHSNMDSCSYHVSLGSTRTIPFLEGWVSPVGRERVSGITCGGVWGFVALVWRMIELQVSSDTKTSENSNFRFSSSE